MRSAIGARTHAPTRAPSRWIARLRIAVVFGGLVSCRRGESQSEDASAAARAEQSSPAPSSSSSLLAARCRPTAVGFLLDDGAPGRDDVELGDALAYPQGYAVGFIHRASSGRVAAVALLRLETGQARVVDLGPTLGDAPPPRIAWRSSELVAARFALPGGGTRLGDTSRELAVHAVESAPPHKAFVSIPQAWDDSLAFDLAFSGGDGLVVWDEETAADGGRAGRGVIRAASLQGEQRGATRDVSPPESDAEAPRVMPVGKGFIAMWLARKPEPTGAAESSATLETTGEARSYGWLEAITLDQHGNATAPLRRLTSPTGHVSAFDVRVLSVATKPVLVVARDDGEAVDGSGGALLRLRAGEDGVEPAAAFPSDGLGRGAPTFVDGPALWLSWVGPHEQLRLLPLDAAGAPVASASAEDTFDEARPLAFLSENASKSLGTGEAGGPWGTADAKLLVATPNDPAAALRLFACSH